VILVALFLLGFVGLFVLVTTNSGLFWQQLGFLVVGFVIIAVLSQLDRIILWWFAPYGYVLSILFLAAAYLGPSIRGATRWIMVAGIQLQPSELVKPFVILAFARLISTYSPRSFRWILLHFGAFIVPFLLVFKQPDLGTALVYASSWFAMMIAGGFSLLLVIVGATVITLGFPFLWHVLAPYQKGRIMTFLDPALDPKGAGYNALQAMIAVGSGQLFGRGLGRGTQSHLRFLPEYHTDFIFATMIEELGFTGGVVLFALYATLLWNLLKPYLRGLTGNPFVFFYTVGLFAVLLTQVVINTGMNMGIIPVTGITLPFVSYGGSSILSLCTAFGFLMALRRADQNETSIAFR
jgi:rod shape determining protein RodA